MLVLTIEIFHEINLSNISGGLGVTTKLNPLGPSDNKPSLIKK